jgi:hypothetical protein
LIYSLKVVSDIARPRERLEPRLGSFTGCVDVDAVAKGLGAGPHERPFKEREVQGTNKKESALAR